MSPASTKDKCVVMSITAINLTQLRTTEGYIAGITLIPQ